jgi:hypothetical protein
MPKRVIDEELWTALRNYYFAHPADHVGAARAVGCVYRTARRAWEEGWPKAKLRPWCRPILKVWEERQAQRREALADLAETLESRKLAAKLEIDLLREQARQEAEATHRAAIEAAEKEVKRRIKALQEMAQVDALETQAHEYALVRGTRNFALALADLGQRVVKAGLLDKLLEAVEEGLREAKITPKQAVGFMKDLAWFARTQAETLKLTLENERLRVGDPTQVVKVEIEEYTEEESLRVLRHAGQLAELIERQVRKPEAVRLIEAELNAAPAGVNAGADLVNEEGAEDGEAAELDEAVPELRRSGLEGRDDLPELQAVDAGLPADDLEEELIDADLSEAG